MLQSHSTASGAGPLAALATPARRLAVAVAPRTPDASSLFNWAELAYPSLFEPLQSNQNIDVWTYRYYPKTDIYLGTNTSGDVRGLVGKGGGQYNAVALGKIADFSCLVYPSDCTLPQAAVSILAGTDQRRFVDANGTAARFNGPIGIAVDSVGNTFVADSGNHAIRKITPLGDVTTLAGSGTAGFVNGVGAAASFGDLGGIAVDSVGNVYVSDSYIAIRKITPTGVVTTLAGGRTSGYDNGTGAEASFNGPVGIAVDGAGYVYVSDRGNHAIRKISPAGEVTTLAGNGAEGSSDGVGVAASFSFPGDVTVDAAGNVYVADRGNYAIRKITPGGMVTTLAGNGTYGFDDGTGVRASFSSYTGIAVDRFSNVYVADTGNHAVRMITPAGKVTTLAGNGDEGFVNGTGVAARFYHPVGVAVDSAGNLYVADNRNHAIRKITPSGLVTTLAGYRYRSLVDGNAAAASFNRPDGVAVDVAGNVYVADTDNHAIRKIGPTGVTTTLAGNGVQGMANGTGTGAQFRFPGGVAVDSDGNVYVSDSWNNAIRKITPVGVVTTLAGNGVPQLQNGTGAEASFLYPQGIAVDNMGNVYVADSGNNVIRKVTPDGVVTTFAGDGSYGFRNGSGVGANFNEPNGVAVDNAGNVYVADVGNHAIRKITPTGEVSTLAGNGAKGFVNGIGSAALFHAPVGIAVDGVGNVYVADARNNAIRQITPAGVTTTLVNNCISGIADGTDTEVYFGRLGGIAVDGAGNVYFADAVNHAIHKVVPWPAGRSE